MGRARGRFAWVWLGALWGGIAHGYTPTVTAGGEPVTWRGQAKLNLAANPINRNGIDEGRFRASMVRSLQRWQAASGGLVGFDYWQGADRGIYLTNSDYNGLASIYFASNAQSDARLSANVLGLTQVWYDTATGQILEADIVLNDKDFRFTTDPQDTSGYGSGGPTGGASGVSQVYIENVLTHELGHAFGLSHSGGLQSTMLFMESPEQAHLGCDEQAALRAVYGGGDTGSRGLISGSVLAESGQPVFGAHVLAVSRRRGTVMATAVTDASGRYRIAALEPGSYYLMVEPYYAGPSALPAYYARMSGDICPGRGLFARAFLVGEDGASPLEVRVLAGATVTPPALLARCGTAKGAAVRSASGAAGFSGAPSIYEGTGAGFGATSRFDTMTPIFYKLRNLSGRLEVHALSYSLYSPVRTALSLLDAAGNPVVSAQAEEQVYAGDSGYVNFDSALVAEALPPGDYFVEVRPTAMDATRYPAAPVALDAAPFLLLTGSVNEGEPALAAILPTNARCRMSENFAAYASPPGDPPRYTVSGEGDGGGFCGTIATSRRTGGGAGMGSVMGSVMGWFLPWAAMLATLRAMRRNNVLSRLRARLAPANL